MAIMLFIYPRQAIFPDNTSTVHNDPITEVKNPYPFCAEFGEITIRAHHPMKGLPSFNPYATS
jgi:hypothetical protein